MEKYNYWLSVCWAAEYSVIPTTKTVVLAELIKDTFIDHADGKLNDEELKELDTQYSNAADTCRHNLLNLVCKSLDITCDELFDESLDTCDLFEYSPTELARHNMMITHVVPTVITEEEYNALLSSSTTTEDYIEVWQRHVIAVKHRACITGADIRMNGLEGLRSNPATQCALEHVAIISNITGEPLSAYDDLEKNVVALREMSYNSISIAGNIGSSDMNLLMSGDLRLICDILPMTEPSRRFFGDKTYFVPDISKFVDIFKESMKIKIGRNRKHDSPIRLNTGEILVYVMDRSDIMLVSNAQNWGVVLDEELNVEPEES